MSERSVLTKALPLILALSVTTGLVVTIAVDVHTQTYAKCTTSGYLSGKTTSDLSAPFSSVAGFAGLEKTDVWKNVISQLLVNRDKKEPCFGISDTELWTAVVSKIPADTVAVQTTADQSAAIVYVSGIPDYLMETPKVFSSFKPGLTYGIFRLAAKPTADDRPVHDFASKGTVGIFVNGVSIFNYTDTFAYENKGVWSFDANVAEALIVNSDVSHCTPSNLPQLPKSRGIFHNHQMSVKLLEQLKDPYFLGERAHSKLAGFAIDSNPIYGPLGYTSKDQTSGVKVLKSSYVKREWLATGTNHRSSVPEWVVLNWNNSNASSKRLLNLFQELKADMLYADGAADGPVKYNGTDGKLGAEIKAINVSVGLKRDAQGYAYWEYTVVLANGDKAAKKNYLLKSSELWGPDFDAQILPATYQVADKDKFYFKARIGAFAEDYEFVAGYGDLDFFNGIDSYLPERGTNAYHYVATFSADVTDSARLKSASFPYFIGIQYKSKPDAFNDSIDNTARTKFFSEGADSLKTVFDLGITGKNDQGQVERADIPALWQNMFNKD